MEASGWDREREVAIVVPCYDEADRLDPEAFLGFLEARPGLRWIFVDDGSRDETGRVLADLERKASDRIRVISFAANRGKAEAVRCGLRAALDEGAELVGFWDADLATPLEEIDRFVARFRAEPALELLLGSRVRLLGRRIERKPVRHYLGRIAATLVSAVLGLAIYDTQCGAKVFRANATLRRILEDPFLTRWIFDVEILARWLKDRAGDRSRVPLFIHELPLLEWRDVSGSRLRPRDFLRVPLDLWRIRRRYGGGTP